MEENTKEEKEVKRGRPRKEKNEVKEVEPISEKEKNSDIKSEQYDSYQFENSNSDITAKNSEHATTPPKKKNAVAIILVIIGLLLASIICIALILTIHYSGDINGSFNKNNNREVHLQYTDTAATKSEGTYIIDVSDVVENVMPSIVAITSKTRISTGSFGPFFGNQEQYSTGAGSGIIVSKNDTELLVLTNNHVVDGAEELSVQFINDKSVDAKLKGKSATRDLAIIAIPLNNIDDETIKNIKIATMGDSKSMKVGNGVIAIGNALGYGQSVTTGVISALDRTVSIDGISNKMIQIDAAINGGNSGGALLNSKGEVIGINSAKYSSSGYSSQASIEGMGFAIPISDVAEIIESLMNGEQIAEEERGVLGITGYVIDEATASSYNMPSGFYIQEILENSGADKAGLEIGDIITEIEGNKVSTYEVISEILSTKKAGEKVNIKIAYVSGRVYKEKNLNVTLSKNAE